MAHWANAYIGMPWESGARGPAAFDCWGLFIETQRRLFGLEIPDTFESIDWDVFAHDWTIARKPREGDAVLMRRPGHPHIGIWVAANGGRVLHALNGAGVILSDTAYLKSQGWRPAFYRYVRARPLH